MHNSNYDTKPVWACIMHQKAKGLYNTPSVQAIFWEFVLLAIVSREKLHINYMIFGNLDIKFDGDK